MGTSTRFGIVAAMEREIRPLLRRAQRVRATPEFVFYDFSNAVVICGGIGKAAAGRAAQAMVEAHRPSVLVSAGFAGAANQDLKVGDIFMPSEVMDVAEGKRLPAGGRNGLLVTLDGVARQEEKMKVARKGASAVDMEAAAVAAVAQRAGMRFLAVKAISDEVDFDMPMFDRFVSAGGKFHTAQFITHVVLRPSMWRSLRKLAANSARATHALSGALDTLLREGNISKGQIGAIVRVDA